MFLPSPEPLLSFGKAFTGVINYLDLAKKEHRASVADYLEHISEVLKGISANMKEGQRCRDLCEELERYSSDFISAVGEYIPEEAGRELFDGLEGALTSPGAYLQQIDRVIIAVHRTQEVGQDEHTKIIEMTAGMFKAAAVKLRLPPAKRKWWKFWRRDENKNASLLSYCGRCDCKTTWVYGGAFLKRSWQCLGCGTNRRV